MVMKKHTVISKRGTAMVEAAVVIPVVILAIVSVIYLMLVMYNDMAAKCDADYDALCAAGEETENHRLEPAGKYVSTYQKHGMIMKYVTISESYSTSLGGLYTRNSAGGIAEGRCYSFSEEDYIRNMDMIGSFAGM